MDDSERRDLQCDVLVFVATQTEEDQLVEAARNLGIGVVPRRSSLGEYYGLGRLGDAVVNAVRIKMGPFGYGGSASAGILFREATAATGIVQVGMAFGVDRNSQRIGDVLVSTALLPYDSRDVRTKEDRYEFDYRRVVRHPAKQSLLRILQDETAGGQLGHAVHFGELLSGAARIFSTPYLKELMTLVPGVEDGIVGGEMEGVGLLSVSPRKQPAWIVVKGICDFADELRDKEIEQNRPVACGNAARLVLSALQRTKHR